MERRKFPRQDVRGVGLKATLVLMGGSLLKKNIPAAVEIQASPLNMSRSGVCLALDVNAPWETLNPEREIDIMLERGEARELHRGRVIRFESEDQLLGFEFNVPLKEVSRFLLPHELH